MRNAILASALLLATPLAGDQLRIATSNDWRQWQLPGDAIEVARGTLKPSFVRRNINAVANAFDFASGGIRKVGSNPGDALIYNKNGKQVTQKQYNKLIPRWTSSSFLFLPTALRFSGLVRG